MNLSRALDLKIPKQEIMPLSLGRKILLKFLLYLRLRLIHQYLVIKEL